MKAPSAIKTALKNKILAGTEFLCYSVALKKN